MHRAPAARRDIDDALSGWQNWAMITDNTVNLADIDAASPPPASTDHNQSHDHTVIR